MGSIDLVSPSAARVIIAERKQRRDNAAIYPALRVSACLFAPRRRAFSFSQQTPRYSLDVAVRPTRSKIKSSAAMLILPLGDIYEPIEHLISYRKMLKSARISVQSKYGNAVGILANLLAESICHRVIYGRVSPINWQFGGFDYFA